MGGETQSANVRAFIAANKAHGVVSGAAFKQGGGRYTLSSGKSYRFTLKEMRSMPAPRWDFEA